MLYEGLPPKDAVTSIMMRETKPETRPRAGRLAGSRGRLAAPRASCRVVYCPSCSGRPVQGGPRVRPGS